MNRRAYYCTLRGCKSHYEDIQVLKAHYNDKHQMEFESPFVCKDCGSSFILEDALFYHQKTIHSYENEIVKCNPCNLDFYSTGNSNFLHKISPLDGTVYKHAYIVKILDFGFRVFF